MSESITVEFEVVTKVDNDQDPSGKPVTRTEQTVYYNETDLSSLTMPELIEIILNQYNS